MKLSATIWGPLIGLVLAGCADSVVDDRFHAQQAVGATSVAADRLRVAIDPGASPLVEEAASDCGDPTSFRPVAPFRLRTWSSAPTPTFVFEHGDRDAVMIETRLMNTLTGSRWVPTVQPLSDRAGCGDVNAEGAIFLAQLNTESLRPNERSACVRVPRCGRVKIQALPTGNLGESGGTPLEFLVVGEVRGSEETFAEAMTAGLEHGPDFAVSLGNLTDGDSRIDMLAWRDLLVSNSIPLVTALGPIEGAGPSLLPFHEVLGRSDFSFLIGEVLFLVMDTSSAEYGDDQFAYWDSVLGKADAGVIIALMHTPPLDPAGLRDNGFSSRGQSARLMSMLSEHGVDTIFTGGIGSFANERESGIHVVSTGGAGTLESGDNSTRHLLHVTVDPASEDPVTVETVTF